MQNAALKSDNSSKINWILEKLPEKRKSQARSLLKYLLDGKGFAFSTTNGEISFDGIIGPKSHVVDLISLAINPRPTKNWKIPGIDLFCTALKSLNVTTSLLSTPMRNILNENSSVKNPKWITYNEVYS